MKIWKYSDFPDEIIRFYPDWQALGKNRFCFDALWDGQLEPRNFDVEIVSATKDEIILKFKLRK